MKSNKPASQNQFAVFVDEHSPEDLKEVEAHWRKTKLTQRNTMFNRLMVGGALAFGLLLVLMINLFLPRDIQHSVLDDSDREHLLLQTNLPYLRLLLRKDTDSFETRMLKGAGLVYGETLTWLEGNVVPSMRVLLIPNERAGCNPLGMALGYYLSTAGHLDIVANTPDYQQLTLKNLDLMKQQHPLRMPLFLIGAEKVGQTPYDLVVIENNDFHQQLEKDKYPILVAIRKESSSNTLASAFPNYSLYEIGKGRINEQMKPLGRWFGYSLKTYSPSPKEESHSLLLLKQQAPALNLCEQTLTPFQSAPHLRNLLEHLRNQTIPALYYALEDQYTLSRIATLTHLKTIYTDATFDTPSIVAKLNDLPPSALNQIVLTFADAMKLASRPPGTLVISVSNKEQAKAAIEKLGNKQGQLLSPYNNKGCFYPPHLLPADSDFSFTTPFFAVLPDPTL